MQVYGYCRVSTAEQANGGLSLDFVEAGVSGSVPLADRPEGQRLLTSLQPGDVVIAASLTAPIAPRLTRWGHLSRWRKTGSACI